VVTDLAFELSSFITVVVVDIDVRSLTKGTASLMRNFGGIKAVFNRTKRFTVIRLILRQKELIVF